MSATTATAAAGCPFCQMVMEYIATGEGIEQIGASGVYHFEPLEPVTPGHRLFIPAFHYEHAAEAPSATGAVFEWAAYWAAQRGEDFNLIVNAGPAASQTVRHLHVHYVPRRPGDGLILPWSSLAAKRAEWEAEQGETEWGYLSGETTIGGDPHVQRVGYDGEPFTREQASGRGRQLMRRRKAGAWLPVPDTGAEDEFAPGECDGSGTCTAAMHIHGCFTPHRSDQCDSPDEYGHIDTGAES